MRPLRFYTGVILLVGFTTPSALAQKSSGGAFGMWSIKSMTVQACDNIAKRYNLTPDQDKYTRALMARNVKSWLGKHGGDFEKLAAEILKNGIASKNAPPPEMVKSWAKRAKPMFDDAKSFILAGNEDWAEILNDDQKRIHEFDLKQMEPQFAQMDKQFARWEEGKWEKGDYFLPRPQPAGPRTGSGAQVNPPREHFWKLYVDRYISRYKLNEAQKESAYAILKDCRSRAVKYRESHQKEIDDATEKMRASARRKETKALPKDATEEMRETARKNDAKALGKAREELGQLNKPISELFAELKDRLIKLPTDAQRADYETGLAAQRQKNMEARKKRVAGKKEAEKPNKTIQPKAPKTPASTDGK